MTVRTSPNVWIALTAMVTLVFSVFSLGLAEAPILNLSPSAASSTGEVSTEKASFVPEKSRSSAGQEKDGAISSAGSENGDFGTYISENPEPASSTYTETVQVNISAENSIAVTEAVADPLASILGSRVESKDGSDPVPSSSPSDRAPPDMKDHSGEGPSENSTESADVSTPAAVSTSSAPKEAPRFNFADEQAGAKVISNSKDMKKASSVLNDREKNKYMMAPCVSSKWFVLQLSEEIMIDTIVVANYEHYSSAPKDFQILGSTTYPTQSWLLLGNFRAAKHNKPQTFRIETPEEVTYLKVRLLTHYGNEHFCTMSSLVVYGQTMLEGLKEELVKDEPASVIAVKELAGDQQQQHQHEHPDICTKSIHTSVESVDQKGNACMVSSIPATVSMSTSSQEGPDGQPSLPQGAPFSSTPLSPGSPSPGTAEAHGGILETPSLSGSSPVSQRGSSPPDELSNSALPHDQWSDGTTAPAVATPAPEVQENASTTETPSTMPAGEPSSVASAQSSSAPSFSEGMAATGRSVHVSSDVSPSPTSSSSPTPSTATTSPPSSSPPSSPLSLSPSSPSSSSASLPISSSSPPVSSASSTSSSLLPPEESSSPSPASTSTSASSSPVIDQRSGPQAGGSPPASISSTPSLSASSSPSPYSSTFRTDAHPPRHVRSADVVVTTKASRPVSTRNTRKTVGVNKPDPKESWFSSLFSKAFGGSVRANTNVVPLAAKMPLLVRLDRWMRASQQKKKADLLLSMELPKWDPLVFEKDIPDHIGQTYGRDAPSSSEASVSHDVSGEGAATTASFTSSSVSALTPSSSSTSASASASSILSSLSPTSAPAVSAPGLSVPSPSDSVPTAVASTSSPSSSPGSSSPTGSASPVSNVRHAADTAVSVSEDPKDGRGPSLMPSAGSITKLLDMTFSDRIAARKAAEKSSSPSSPTVDGSAGQKGGSNGSAASPDGQVSSKRKASASKEASNVFKALAIRVKELEVNQALSALYIDELVQEVKWLRNLRDQMKKVNQWITTRNPLIKARVATKQKATGSSPESP